MVKEETHKISDLRLVIHFKIEKPVELAELSRSFLSVADLYESSLSKSMKEKGKDNNIGLYVSKIENNCFLMELGPLFVAAYEVISQELQTVETDADKIERLKALLKFSRDISPIIRKFMDIVDNRSSFKLGIKITKTITIAVSNLLSFLEKSDDGELDIKTIDYEENEDGEETIIDEFSNKDLKKAKKGVDIVLDLFKKTTYEKHPKPVLLHFTRVNTSNKSQAGFLGIIKDINDAEFPIDEFPISVIKPFSDRIRNDIKDGNLNQVTDSYNATVLEKYKDGKLKSYKIMDLGEVVQKTHNSQLITNN